jgi:hypothetical protein
VASVPLIIAGRSLHQANLSSRAALVASPMRHVWPRPSPSGLTSDCVHLVHPRIGAERVEPGTTRGGAGESGHLESTPTHPPAYRLGAKGLTLHVQRAPLRQPASPRVQRIEHGHHSAGRDDGRHLREAHHICGSGHNHISQRGRRYTAPRLPHPEATPLRVRPARAAPAKSTVQFSCHSAKAPAGAAVAEGARSRPCGSGSGSPERLGPCALRSQRLDAAPRPSSREGSRAAEPEGSGAVAEGGEAGGPRPMEPGVPAPLSVRASSLAAPPRRRSSASTPADKAALKLCALRPPAACARPRTAAAAVRGAAVVPVREGACTSMNRRRSLEYPMAQNRGGAHAGASSGSAGYEGAHKVSARSRDRRRSYRSARRTRHMGGRQVEDG